MSDYNGYTNRETWLINLYLGEYLQEVANDGKHLMADYIESTMWDMLGEANIPDIFKDMIDLGAVNWRELEDLYVSEAA
tara:strand:- start:271 stop:507 length:237 start_codon:yes stop_codon:yes gene_type:complete